jgi:hypothetical protein
LAVGLGVLMVAVLACGAPDLPTASIQSTAPSASSEPVRGEWGPLAVAACCVGGDFARNEGVLHISDRCVSLDASSGQSILLLWGSDTTTWDPQANAIHLKGWDGQVVTLRDGQSIIVGGSGESFTDDPAASEGLPWQEWVERIDWVAEPDESCAAADGYWGVGNAEVPTSPTASALASEPAVSWGPLTVQGPPELNMDAAISGRLRITNACVFLIAPPDDEILLVWPAERTSWDEQLRTITVINHDESVVTLRDGMSIRLGGGGFSDAESDLTMVEWLQQRRVGAPDAQCIPSEAWIVADVIEVE